MNANDETPKGIPFNIVQRIPYAIGSVVSQTLVKKDTGTVTLFSFAEGQGLSEHTAPFDAVVQVIDGSAQITVGTTTHTVDAGQMLIMPADVPHALHALQPFKMLLIMIRSR